MLCSEAGDRWEDLMDSLEIDYQATRARLTGSCPVHGGDRPNAFNLYLPNDNYMCNWKCRTHQCEKVFLNTLVGLVRGVLSHKKYNWQAKGDTTAGFGEAVQYLLDFVDKDYASIKVNPLDIEKKRFAYRANLFNPTIVEHKNKIPKEKVRGTLEIPAQYYINLGYSPEVLDSYDVGLCNNPSKAMYNRVVVPIYDDLGKHMIGCTGRTLNPLCEKCECWHPIGNHVKEEDRLNPRWAKWRHNGFEAENTLYNFWRAKDVILATGVAILVEGPGDVWRLEEAGIHNSVAMFGTSLKNGQKAILDASCALSLIVLTDNDEAGMLAAQEIREQCRREYRLYFPKINAKDIGAMTVDSITTDIKPTIDSVLKILGVN